MNKTRPSSIDQDSKVTVPLVILITGCSSGFGMLMAARLASKGHIVYATMRDLSKENSLLEEVSRRGGQVHVRCLDVTSPSTSDDVLKTIEAEHHRLDVLINNAGIGIVGFFEDLTEEEIRLQMETNFLGLVNLTRQSIPLLKKGQDAKIINISSVSGFTSSPAFSGYSASKHALEGWSESLRYELRLSGINIHNIRPGSYNTPIFHENARVAKGFHNPESPYFEFGQKMMDFVYGRLKKNTKDPEEIAEVAEKIINGQIKAFRVIPDFESKIQYALRRLLPFSIYSKIVETVFRKKLTS